MGGVVTTSLDVLAWDRALRGDKVLGDAAKAKLYAPALEGYACGWVVSTTDRGTTRVEHSGGVRGYGVQIARWLEDDAIVVVLSNGKTNPTAVEKTIAEILFAPPKITADLDVEDLSLSKYRAFESKESLSLVVDAVEGDVRIRLRQKDRVIATIRTPKTLAKALGDELEQAIASSAFDKPDEPATLEGGLYLGFLRDGGTKIHLDDGLTLRVQSRYEGQGENGESITDERAVLVLDSTKDHGWPVMVRMNPKAAKALLDAIRKG
jgi:hypothetical protein